MASNLTSINLHLTHHALVRLNERFGEKYWQGRRIKDMNLAQKKNFILHGIRNKTEKLIIEEKRTVKIVTALFTAVIGISQKIYLVKTIFKSSTLQEHLFYKIPEVLNKDEKQLLIINPKKEKAIGSRIEPTAF